MKTIIVGAGASGVVASLNIKNSEVLVIEKNSKPLKKLLTTGNSHCNYFNDDQDLKHYYSDNKDLISSFINDYNIKLVLDFFDSLGIVPLIKDGYYYPYSNTSISICNTLYEESLRRGVKYKFLEEVISIQKIDNYFIVKTNLESYKCDKVILSSGSSASIKEGVNTYKILDKLNIKYNSICPSLTRINLDFKYLKDVSGIRSYSLLRLISNNQVIKEEEGEVLFTNNGLSGICTMMISNMCFKELKKNNDVEVSINFMSDFCVDRSSFINLMDTRDSNLKGRDISELLDTYLNYKLVNAILKKSEVNKNKWSSLNDREKNIIAREFVDSRFKVLSTDDISKSQTVSGGVSLNNINLNTMESLDVEGLYLTGEVIDINGDCGGYNLTIAWISGILAGRSI